jgi:hypothetical protein
MENHGGIVYFTAREKRKVHRLLLEIKRRI